MRDVADRVGVHPATVSRALRNDPRITPEQRAKVLKVAAEMGYRKNPMIAALMSARRSRKAPAYQATLAFLTRYPSARAAFFQSEFGNLLGGARTHALAQGYRLEEFNLHDPDLTPTRITKILLSRGTRGLIVAPLHSIHEPIELDWAQFSAVAIGDSLPGVLISRVAHNHFSGLALSVRECRALGRRRIGLVLPRRVHEKVEKRWLAALLLDQSEHPGERVPPLLLEDWSEPEFAAWFREHRPDALLCINVQIVQTWLARLEVAAGDVLIVSLDHRARDGAVMGIDQNYPQMGAVAVDTVIGMIHRNERGLPAKPLKLLLDGTWMTAGGAIMLAPVPPSLGPLAPSSGRRG